MNTQPLPYPTAELVHMYIQRFEQDQVVVEQALSKLFHAFPRNTAFDEVLLKVVALNSLYATNIFATYHVAEHIVRSNVDARLHAGRPEVVDLIARVQIKDKTRNNYSFATKYCAWHNPLAYPLYDYFVEAMLWGYRKQDAFASFRRVDLWKYEQFKHAVESFRSYYHLAAFSLKDIDKFLWLAGKEFFPRTW